MTKADTILNRTRWRFSRPGCTWRPSKGFRRSDCPDKGAATTPRAGELMRHRGVDWRQDGLPPGWNQFGRKATVTGEAGREVRRKRVNPSRAPSPDAPLGTSMMARSRKPDSARSLTGPQAATKWMPVTSGDGHWPPGAVGADPPLGTNHEGQEH